MIVSFEGLADLRRRVTMVDGSFDPIHDGHVAYFKAARELGDPVLCNVAPDGWTLNKHPVLLPKEQRAIVLDAIRYIDYVYCSELPTAEVLGHLRPIRLVKGSDWRRRGGLPEAESRTCAEWEIEIVYVDTVTNSSSAILSRLLGGHQ